MAKKETGLKATLSSLGPKVPVKQTTVDVEKTEAATKVIHSGKKEKTYRQTVDLPEEVFKQWKIKLVMEGKTMQETLLGLVENYIKH